MKLTIFGATGKTGLLLCDLAVRAGHEVTAYVRDPAKLAQRAGDVTVVEGSLEDETAIRAAVEGRDAVISALGTFDRKPNTVLSEGTRRIIEAMQAAHVARLVAITSLGCGDSRAQVNNWIMRLVIKTIAKEIWADKDRQEKVIRASRLDYLVVRPGGLTDKPQRGTWTELRSGESSKGKQMIPRADVAGYIIKRLEKPALGQDFVVLF